MSPHTSPAQAKTIHVRYSWFLRAVAGALLVFSGYAWVVFRPVTVPSGLPADLFWTGFTAVCTGLLVESLFTHVYAGPGGIRYVSPWRKTQLVAWTDIQAITYGAIFQSYKLKTKHSGSLYMSSSMTGLTQLLQLHGAYADSLRPNTSLERTREG